MSKRPKLFPMPTTSTSMGWHKISAMTRCPKEYQFGTVRGISRYALFEREAISLGTLLHAARAQWLHDGRTGNMWRDMIVHHAKEVERVEKKTLHPSSVRDATRIFEGYVRYWSVRPTTDVLAIEYYMAPRKLKANAPEWAKRTARADSVEADPGTDPKKDGVWIGELKSTYTGGKGRMVDNYLLHGQTLTLAALWGPDEIKRFGPLKGILLDIMLKGDARKKPSGAPRVRIPLSEISYALSWFRQDMEMWIEQASMVEWDTVVERRPEACMRAYGPCEFRDLCLKGRKAANYYVLADGTPLINWEPSPGQKRAPWL